MIGRRGLLGAMAYAAAAASAACAAPRPEAPSAPPPPRLSLDPLVDLVPAAGLVWMVEAQPLAILASPPLAAVVGAAVPDAGFDAFASRHGGVDLRRAEALVVAAEAGTTFGLARLGPAAGSAGPAGDDRARDLPTVDPAAIERAFGRRAAQVEGRASERAVTRFWGTVGREREQVAVFDRRAVGVEVGGFGPLRAAAYFAEGRLKRSLPALRAEPLAAAAARLGPGPLRGFAPGPFGPDWEGGLGGLLRAATAVAARVRGRDGALGTTATADGGPGRRPAVELRLLLTGAWGDQAAEAADRLAASFHVLAEDPLGRLTGLDQPIEGPTATGDPDGLVLDVALDPVTMSRGIRALAGAPLAQMMAF